MVIYYIIVHCSDGHSDTSMSTYSQPSFSSSTWKRGGVWMYRAEKRSGHCTVVSILQVKLVHGSRHAGGEHIIMGDGVCGRVCCC